MIDDSSIRSLVVEFSAVGVTIVFYCNDNMLGTQSTMKDISGVVSIRFNIYRSWLALITASGSAAGGGQ